jgi:hypothetical protein
MSTLIGVEFNTDPTWRQTAITRFATLSTARRWLGEDTAPLDPEGIPRKRLMYLVPPGFRASAKERQCEYHRAAQTLRPHRTDEDVNHLLIRRHALRHWDKRSAMYITDLTAKG